MLGSATALGVKDAYFTSQDTVTWCFKTLSGLYDLSGKTALEPSCGSGAFVRLDLGLKWTTNELYPEYAKGYEPTYNIDFAKGDLTPLGKFDFIIGNPPFGKSTMAARKFVLRSLEIADVVAMVLPFGCRRITFLDKLPTDVRVVHDELIPNLSFELPDGSVKKVKCSFMVFAHEKGYERPVELDLDDSVFRWELGGSDTPEWATHGYGLWSNANKLLDVKASDFKRGCGSTMWLKLTKAQAKKFADFDLSDIIAKTSTSFPRVAWRESVTYLNRFFKE